MRYLTVQEVLFVHFQVVERFGGLQGVLNLEGLDGVRSGTSPGYYGRR